MFLTCFSWPPCAPASPSGLPQSGSLCVPWLCHVAGLPPLPRALLPALGAPFRAESHHRPETVQGWLHSRARGGRPV